MSIVRGKKLGRVITACGADHHHAVRRLVGAQESWPEGLMTRKLSWGKENHKSVAWDPTPSFLRIRQACVSASIECAYRPHQLHGVSLFLQTRNSLVLWHRISTVSVRGGFPGGGGWGRLSLSSGRHRQGVELACDRAFFRARDEGTRCGARPVRGASEVPNARSTIDRPRSAFDPTPRGASAALARSWYHVAGSQNAATQKRFSPKESFR